MGSVEVCESWLGHSRLSKQKKKLLEADMLISFSEVCIGTPLMSLENEVILLHYKHITFLYLFPSIMLSTPTP